MSNARLRGRFPALLVAVLALTAACGRDSEPATTTQDGESAAPPVAEGFDGSTIRVGVITAATGPAKAVGDLLTGGVRVYFDALNERGGIAGKYKVEPVVVDSALDATKGVQQYNATKGDVAMFAQVIGTGVMLAVLPQLKRDGIVGSPASVDAFWVREPNLLPIGAPYQVQTINGLSWYLTEGGGKDQTICSMVADNPYGQAGQAGVDFAAKELGFELGTAAKFTGATASSPLDPTAALAQLKAQNCEAVWLSSTGTDTATILGAAAAQQYAPKWIGNSAAWGGFLAKTPIADYLTENLLIVSEGPEWGDESSTGMKEMLAAVEQYAPDQTPELLYGFGYAQGMVAAAALEKAVENGDLSHDGVLEAVAELGTVSFSGLLGDYTYGPPSDRNPPRTNTIFAVDTSNPTGLKAIKADVSSEAATKYVIP